MPLPCFEQASAALLHSAITSSSSNSMILAGLEPAICGSEDQRGHRTSWNTGSRPLQLQMPPSLELVKSGMCPWRTMGAPACGTGFPHEKWPPFWGSSKLTFLSDRFNQRTAPGLQSVSVFLVRARSFSNFLLGFFLIYFAFSCLFCFRLMVSRFPAWEAIVRAKFWCIPYHFF